MATSSIGASLDYNDLSLWETAKQASSEDEIAELHEDISDSFTMTGWTNPQNITIRSNITGIKRTVTNDVNANLLYFNDVKTLGLTLQDLVLDAGGAMFRSCVSINAGVTALTVKRVKCHNVSAMFAASVIINAGGGALVANATLENCIFVGGYSGFGVYHSTAMTAEIVNCIVTEASSLGYSIADVATHTYNFRNCLGFGNNGDFDNSTTATVNVLNCVSEDATATHANHTSSAGSVTLKTDTSEYFTDYANDDYTLAQIDLASWGIEGDDATTPATDYNNTTRIGNSIGPYDYIESTGSIRDIVGDIVADLSHDVTR
jgi:hypothetical protein